MNSADFSGDDFSGEKRLELEVKTVFAAAREQCPTVSSDLKIQVLTEWQARKRRILRRFVLRAFMVALGFAVLGLVLFKWWMGQNAGQF